MRKHKIALLPGDGVGAEVIEASQKVLDAVASPGSEMVLDFTEYTVGREAYQKTGSALPQNVIDALPNFDAVMLGALSADSVPPPSPMGVLRRTFDLYADVRLIQNYPGVWSRKENIDIVCIRENIQGFLADRNTFKGYAEIMPTEDLVISFRILSRSNLERIAHFAFKYALKHGRKKITAAHKANVLSFGCGFFLDICREVAERYPEIEFNDLHVDAVANELISAPENFDIILSTNMFGDIIGDEAAALVSNLVPTGNLSDSCAIFRPAHEAKIEIEKQGTANPVPAILSASMMLQWLKELSASAAIKAAVRAVLAERKVLTPDLGGNNTGAQMTAAIIARIKEQERP